MESRCAVADCARPLYSRGYCNYHYDRLRRSGNLAPLQKRMPTDGPCAFSGCLTKVYAKGMCNAHYQQAKRGLELTAVGSWLIPSDAKCVGPGCERAQYSRELCNTHYYQQSAGRELTILPAQRARPDGSCEADGCPRSAEDEARGDTLCVSHGIMQRRGVKLVPLVTRTDTAQMHALLARGVYWCTCCQQELPRDRFLTDTQRGGAPRTPCRACSGKSTRAKKFNISFAALDRLFASQDHRCALCGIEAEDGDGLNLDHDHGCCPEKGTSCGKCVRGLLCWGCNAGVVTWYERVRDRVPAYPLLDEYLHNPPALKIGLADRRK
ncbi:endonuclease domain-containing protein [Streptomyces sp. NPDC057889]|uniref:endonuclease domain-containing protein n=1 Tax=unclassified Streptomyces TaxID=2593676 RepID=UPI0036AA87BA